MLKIKRQLLFTTEIISEVQSKPSRKRTPKMQRVSGRLREVIVYSQGPRSKFSSGGAKEQCVKENFGGGTRGGMLVDFYSVSLK